MALAAQAQTKVGIIGLDTSHSKAFTEILNADSDAHGAREFEVVAAYPYGTTTIESAAKRIPEYIEAVKALGVEITGSIAELLEKVDVVLLETNDGRLHLDQAIEVFKSGKICYIDKPLGATLGEAIAIYKTAQKYNAPVFSSSALRFSPENVKLRNGEYGAVIGADVISPHQNEPTHPDFGYYGIHGVETLYTILGEGCESVSRASGSATEVVTGIWKDGRIGTFRALVGGPWLYGGTAYTAEKAIPAGGYAGYEVLLDEILEYFRTGKAPVSAEETVEMFAFMKASNMSKARGGKPVTIAEAMKVGEKDAAKLLKKY